MSSQECWQLLQTQVKQRSKNLQATERSKTIYWVAHFFLVSRMSDLLMCLQFFGELRIHVAHMCTNTCAPHCQAILEEKQLTHFGKAGCVT